MSKYEIIKKLDNYQYTEGCPVFITGGNILKDNENGHIYVQLKFRSLSSKIITAVIISLNCFDIEGKSLTGVERYQFLDLSVKCGETFENKKPILCSDDYTRNCKIIINTVIFDDSSKWMRTDSSQEYILGSQKRIDNWEYKDMNAYFYTELRNMGFSTYNSVYVPFKNDKFWVCTCGLINDINSEYCMCGADRQKQFDFFEEKNLKEKYDYYTKKNEEEKQEKIRRKRQKEAREKEEREKALALLKEEELKIAEENRKKTIKAGILIGIGFLLYIIFIISSSL